MSNVSQTIQRLEPTPVHPGVPLINHVVIHGDIVYLAGITLLQALPVAALSALVQPGGGATAALGNVSDQTRAELRADRRAAGDPQAPRRRSC